MSYSSLVPGARPPADSASPFRVAYVPGVSPAYLSQKLTRPLPTKDRGTLRTILEARAYMLALPKQRETRTQWQRAAELLLGEASVADFSKAVELALFYDAKLDVSNERGAWTRTT